MGDREGAKEGTFAAADQQPEVQPFAAKDDLGEASTCSDAST